MKIGILVVTAVACLAPGVDAATRRPPKPACNIMTDAEGDGAYNLLKTYNIAKTAGLNSRAMDIVGGDMVSGSKTVVVQVRLVSTDYASDPMTSRGVTWAMNFTIGGVPFSIATTRTPSGDSTTFSVDRQAQGDGVISTKIDGTSVTWTLDRKKFTPLMKKAGQKFTSISAGTSGNLGTNSNADSGDTTNTYLDKLAHCKLKAS